MVECVVYVFAAMHAKAHNIRRWKLVVTRVCDLTRNCLGILIWIWFNF